MLPAGEPAAATGIPDLTADDPLLSAIVGLAAIGGFCEGVVGGFELRCAATGIYVKGQLMSAAASLLNFQPRQQKYRTSFLISKLINSLII